MMPIKREFTHVAYLSVEDPALIILTLPLKCQSTSPTSYAVKHQTGHCHSGGYCSTVFGGRARSIHQEDQCSRLKMLPVLHLSILPFCISHHWQESNPVRSILWHWRTHCIHNGNWSFCFATFLDPQQPSQLIPIPPHPTYIKFLLRGIACIGALCSPHLVRLSITASPMLRIRPHLLPALRPMTALRHKLPVALAFLVFCAVQSSCSQTKRTSTNLFTSPCHFSTSVPFWHVHQRI